MLRSVIGLRGTDTGSPIWLYSFVGTCGYRGHDAVYIVCNQDDGHMVIVRG